MQRTLSKGLKTIIKCSQQHDMTEFLCYLKTVERLNTDLFDHTDCRRNARKSSSALLQTLGALTDSRKRSLATGFA